MDTMGLDLEQSSHHDPGFVGSGKFRSGRESVPTPQAVLTIDANHDATHKRALVSILAY